MRTCGGSRYDELKAVVYDFAGGCAGEKAPWLFALMQQLPELPDDVLEIPCMDVEFRDVEF